MALGGGQQWNPRQYGENARFVSDLGMPVVALLAPRPGERILDLGCGDGALTVKLVEAGCEVIGVDASPAMIEAARSLGLDACVADAEHLAFHEDFDAVFSNAALHWMKDAPRVVAGVWQALRPGGRFVGEFGGHGNVAAIVDALNQALAARGLTVDCPWFFPRADDYRELLEGTDFAVTRIELLPRPTPLPGDVGGWLETFAHPYLAALPPGERGPLVEDVVDRLGPRLCDASGIWTADYVRLRFAATKSGVATIG